jgi:hypothetical protein
VRGGGGRVRRLGPGTWGVKANYPGTWASAELSETAGLMKGEG